MTVITLDTGALIGMEKNRERGLMLLRAAKEHRAQLLAPTPIVAEWWRGRTDVRDRIKRAVTIVPYPLAAAEAAGLALGALRTRRQRAELTVDVMVVAFAAVCGGALIYTSDVDDLENIATRFFPSVHVLGV